MVIRYCEGLEGESFSERGWVDLQKQVRTQVRRHFWSCL